MRRVSVQFLDQGFHRVLFDAMPIPIFVVDQDVRILDYNKAAGQLIDRDRRSVIRRRGGEVLNCVHATETPGGCGRAPACHNCVIRKAVYAAYLGRRVTRQKARMELDGNGKRTKVSLRVSCQPFTYGRQSFFLLILEGLND